MMGLIVYTPARAAAMATCQAVHLRVGEMRQFCRLQDEVQDLMQAAM